MSEDTDLLLPRKAKEPSPFIPGVHIRAFSFREHGNGLQIGKPMEGDRLGEREEQLPRVQHLHGDERFPGEASHVPLERIGGPPKVGGGGRCVEVGGRRAVGGGEGDGGVGAIDPEGSVGASEEELGAVRLDGLDLGGAVGEELEGIVSAVHHLSSSRAECTN